MNLDYYKIPDFSFWQDDPTTPAGIDFTQTRQKTRGVILRAGQGKYIDKTFLYNWREAKAAGLLRGAYWFFDSRVDPKTQAKLFADVLKNDPPEILAFFDAEETYGGTYTGWKEWYNFLENFKVFAPEIELGIYTNYYYWAERISQPSTLQYFSQYPLWLAGYNTTTPLIPKPWKEWLFHQFTDDFPSTGWGAQSNEIDMNYFAGSEADFLARYGVGESPTNKSTILAKIGGKIAEYQET